MAGASVPQKFLTWAAALCCCPLLAGCVTTGSWVFEKPPEPATPISQVAATWDNQIHFVPDPLHQGQPNPCLAGRVYLFGPNYGCPVDGDGGISVQLYKELPPEAGGQLVLLEQWNIDPAKTHELKRKDMIGWGSEDKELAARLEHAGVRRRTLLFAGIAYHLHHELAPRDREAINDAIYRETVRQRRTRCAAGLNLHQR